MCIIDACTDRPTRSNGMCESHFHRWYTYGDPNRPLGRTRSNATWEERLTSDKWDEAPGPLETPCWVWKKQVDQYGYGVIKYHQRSYKAHRAMYALHVGPIPPGHNVCHVCDNPPCVRPEHLFSGTQNDNVQDAKAKGRTRAPRGKTVEEVKAAKQMVREGATQTQAAKTLGVDTGTMSRIMRGLLYADVD